ncbi:hypothetical protein HC891_25890 [Candidatus Gracilibacteria bacterium]|nr:hypothetical protein [Candidatus Gracilibacteria bacterium]
MEADDGKKIVAKFKKYVERESGKPFPADPKQQLWGAVSAVFQSWRNERAKVYRRLHDIPESWGTAVNVQAMVFGNMGETSATGVAFTRDEKGQIYQRPYGGMSTDFGKARWPFAPAPPPRPDGSYWGADR